jgi:hypothetical protein
MRTPPENVPGQALTDELDQWIIEQGGVEMSPEELEAVLTSPQEHRECLQAVLMPPQEYREYLQAQHAQALSTIGIVMLACALAVFLGKDWRKDETKT